MPRFHRYFGVLFLGILIAACPARAQDRAAIQWKDLEPGRFAWLLDYAGKPASAVVADPRFAVLRDHPLSILKAKADLGDPPQGKTLVRDEILKALQGVPEPVETHLGRYAVLSGCTTAGCRDRAFVWVDTVSGLALSVLLVPASADLPGTTPNLLLASRQLETKWIDRSQLPARFWVDWEQWAFERRLPAVMTERMVNTYGGLSVIFHEDDKYCLDATDTYSEIQCGQKALAAATADLDALLAQVRLHLEPGDPDRDRFDKTQELWTAYRDSACSAARGVFKGGTYEPVAGLECERRLTHDRVRSLNDFYYIVLYD
jgi:uncharacterized protein YecT (DUF1311 family)